MEKKILLNPVMRWAMEPGLCDGIRYLDGVASGPQRIPFEGEVLTLPFIVDAATSTPMPVRITRIEYQQEPTRTIVIAVVVPAQGH